MFKKFFFVYFLLSFIAQPVFAQEEDKKEENQNKSIFQSISFEEGTFFGGLNSSVTKLVKSIEDWRIKQKESFDKSLDSTDSKRELNAKEDKQKTIDNILIIAHLIILAILLFVFSIQFVFFGFLLFILVIVIRKIFNLVKRLFRREDTYV